MAIVGLPAVSAFKGGRAYCTGKPTVQADWPTKAAFRGMTAPRVTRRLNLAVGRLINRRKSDESGRTLCETRMIGYAKAGRA